METVPAHFPDLTVALAAQGGAIPLGQSFGAVHEAIQIVDQQIANLNFIHIQTSFVGGAEMADAVDAMQAAARGWPATRASVVQAAGAVVAAGPEAASLGAPPKVENIFLTAFLDGPLVEIKGRFAAAQAQFSSFSAAMDHAYSVGASANSDAAAAVTRQTQQVQNDIANLNARENNLKSAGSIILGIISFGGTIYAQIHDIENQIGQLREAQAQLEMQERGYGAALGGFRNAQHSTLVASLALQTLDASLQQTANSLKDIAAPTHSDLVVVMQAELSAFKTDFAMAVDRARQLAG